MFDSQSFLKNVTTQAGVYQMLDNDDVVIYVGKAKNLKKRLSSYFRTNISNGKTRVLVSKIANVKIIVTGSETQALILENDLIKHHMPKYNVLLRDDKSYPFIFISDHKHARITSHRGAKKAKGKYFGPYPNSGAVRESLHLMQKIFPIRQCEDAYYRNRTRACLQHQLKRCLAPCVDGLVSDEEYASEVKLASLFLSGDSQDVLDQVIAKMEQASQSLQFESAARYRDQLTALRKVQEQQWINSDQSDVDVIGFNYEHGIACFHTLFIRHGKVLGSRSYFPKIPKDTDSEELYSAFILQFYLNTSAGRQIPRQVLHDAKTLESKAIEDALTSEAGYKVSLHSNTRGDRAKLVEMAQRNARIGLESKLAQKGTQLQRIVSLEKIIDSEKIARMECFDISHTSGQQTVASCVVFDREGPAKGQYRKFNIEGITPGDDYGAMNQALSRRFAKANDPMLIPDILFIDGGRGQLSEAEAVMAKYQDTLPKMPLLIGVAKGEGRKAGLETLFVGISREIIDLENDNPALHLIQHIRDESHRFAITGHRARRAKVKNTSTLESIPGIGPKRRQSLIKNMGGLQQLKSASQAEIAKVPGISNDLAQIIYDALN